MSLGASIAAAILGYALGSIPFGLILARAAGLGDIRAIGSGNIGATNVLRTGRKGLAAGTLLLDAFKGVLAVLLAGRLLGPGAAPLAAVFAIIGHCAPVWLGFKGGKGVATGIGVLLALCWPAGVGAALVWLGVARATRISSLGALIGCVAAPVIALYFAPPWTVGAIVVIAIVIIARHHGNIRRLLAGTEPRIGART